MDRNDDNAAAGGINDSGYNLIRDRLRFKRNPNSRYLPDRTRTLSDCNLRARSHHSRLNRKGLSWLYPFKGKSTLYSVIVLPLFLFAVASMVLQSSIMLVFGQRNERGRLLRGGLKFGITFKFVPGRLLREGLKFGITLKFVPGRLARKFSDDDGLDRIRNVPRLGIRASRLALIFAIEKGNALQTWEQVGSQISSLGPGQYGHIDCFKGVIVDSLEAKTAISRVFAASCRIHFAQCRLYG